MTVNGWSLAEFIMLLVILIILVFGAFQGFPIFT